MFIFDIYMVFKTNIMTEVAKQIIAPLVIKIPFKNQMSFLGLGDIIIPGAFLAFVLKFDIDK